MDNMEWSLASPQEDEFALGATSLKSPCLAWAFPRQRGKYEKYLTFETVDPSEISEWRQAFELFAKKLQWLYGRPLVLKSPPHTGRIKLLLEMFPDARFVHIHRNPYRVFESSRQMFQRMFDWQSLQRLDLHDLDDWILRQYREMYEAFFKEKTLISEGRFHEIRFENLERDAIGEMGKMYEALHLPGYSSVEPVLRGYVDSLRGYRKNSFPELPRELKVRIDREWKACFEAWNYP